jgi:hypothetical protein
VVKLSGEDREIRHRNGVKPPFMGRIKATSAFFDVSTLQAFVTSVCA